MIIGFSFAQCLRHAFFAGAGYGELERISAEDLAKWVAYEPPEVGSFKSMSDHFIAYAALQDTNTELRTALEACVSRLEWFDDENGTEQPWVKPAREALAKTEGTVL